MKTKTQPPLVKTPQSLLQPPTFTTSHHKQQAPLQK